MGAAKSAKAAVSSRSAAIPASWPSEWLDELSDAALRVCAGPAVFDRGRSYFGAAAVQVIEEHGLPEPSIRAHVQGTHRYTTELHFEDPGLHSDCNCPHAQDDYFCKHQVALALQWRALLNGETPAMDEAAHAKVAAGAQRGKILADKEASLRDFLSSQSADELADRLMRYSDQVHEVRKDLLTWQKLSQSGERAADLKPLITELLNPGRSARGYHEAYSYARQAEGVLPLLAKARAQDPAGALKLATAALLKLFAELEEIDDSDGEVGGVCCAVGLELVAALKAAGEQPAAFAQTYFKLRRADPFDALPPGEAEAAMGVAARTRYEKLLADEWRAALDALLAARKSGQKRTRSQRAGNDRPSELETLEYLYLGHLRSLGDVEQTLAVLRSDMSSVNRHMGLVRFYESHERFREALSAAEAAVKAFPDDTWAEDALTQCYERDGWDAEALVLRRRQFMRQPSVATFRAVLERAKAAGADVAAERKDLMAAVHAHEAADFAAESKPGRYRMGPPPAGPVVSTRVALLLCEGDLVQALAAVQPPNRCDARLLQQLAERLPAGQADEAVALLKRVFEHEIHGASSPYLNALAVVRLIAQRLPVDARRAWLAELASQFKAKRNFVRDLPKK